MTAWVIQESPVKNARAKHNVTRVKMGTCSSRMTPTGRSAWIVLLDTARTVKDAIQQLAITARATSS